MSPSPTSTPLPTEVPFDFETSADEWSFSSPPNFIPVTGSYDASNKSIDLTTTDNTDSFGLYQSPLFQISAPSSRSVRGGAPVEIAGLIGGGSLYRATYRVRSNLGNPAVAPTIRLRSNSENFEQADVTVITSTGNGALSPSTTSRAYRQYFSQPANSDMFFLSFDVLNFDTDDAANATLLVEDVMVEALSAPGAGIGTVAASLDFVTNGASGFTFHSAAPVINEPLLHTVGGGLNIAGTVPLPTKVLIPPGTFFGYWGGDSGVSVTGGSLYGVTFEIASDASSAARSHVPTFRLRVNDSSLQFSAYVNIDSRSDSSRIPMAGSPESYTVWFEAPGSISGNSLFLSFDYLHTGDSDDDPATQLTLRTVSVESYAAP